MKLWKDLEEETKRIFFTKHSQESTEFSKHGMLKILYE